MLRPQYKEPRCCLPGKVADVRGGPRPQDFIGNCRSQFDAFAPELTCISQKLENRHHFAIIFSVSDRRKG